MLAAYGFIDSIHFFFNKSKSGKKKNNRDFSQQLESKNPLR